MREISFESIVEEGSYMGLNNVASCDLDIGKQSIDRIAPNASTWFIQVDGYNQTIWITSVSPGLSL